MWNWIRRTKNNSASNAEPLPVDPVDVPGAPAESLSDKEMLLLISARQLAESARVVLTGMQDIYFADGRRRVEIDPDISRSVLAQRLRDFDEIEMDLRAAQVAAGHRPPAGTQS